MPHEHHDWKTESGPPEIRPHSLAKHRVLRAYLEKYVSVLTADPRQDLLKLTLIDGFAGGGRYLDQRTKEERPGSPVIMLDAMRAAEELKASISKKPFLLDAHYLFVESNSETLEYLRNVITKSRYSKLLNEKIDLIGGEFTAQVPSLIEFVKRRGRNPRAIFFLDQFGFTDVPMESIRQILQDLPNAEVILTIATDFLIDYLNSDEKSQRMLSGMGIVIPPKDIKSAKQRRDWRRVIQFALHREIPERTGARFYTPFFIRSADSHRDFWLIHLSGHYRARDVMVGLHWQVNTSFAHYGRSGLRMLGYDQRTDAAWTGQKLLPGFFFDESALAASQDDLMDQLPSRVHQFSDGVSFNDFFAATTNETPVTANIMKEVLNDLVREGVIEVRDKTGAKRRSVIRHGTDVLAPSPQRRIFLP